MGKASKHRPTIGFLIDHTDSQYQFGILQGISDFAENRDVNLICFEGGIIKSTRHFDYERNIIYDLATDHRLDGLIILSDSIAHLLDDDTLLKLCRSYTPLPVISVGRGHAKIPSIVVDSSKGMQELIHHLVVVHRFQSFAFIKGLAGSYHAEVRYKTFLDILAEHGIAVDPDLIFDGDYLELAGRRAVSIMLDKGKKRPEVIVACNDEMAISAMNELKHRGVEVPRDIAVVGFDDILKCGTTDPPLTTVRQPLIKEGWTAMDVLVRMLEGENPPLNTELDSSLIIRESCGCSFAEESIKHRRKPAYTIESNGVSQTPDNQQRTTKRIQSILENISYDYNWLSAENLTRAFMTRFDEAVLNQDAGRFLDLWREFLDKTLHLERDEILLKGVLESLYFIPTLTLEDGTKIEAIFHIASGVLKEKALLQIRKSYNQALKENWILNYLRDELDISLTTEQIIDILHNNLKELGITSSYLAIYEEEETPERLSRLVLACVDEKRSSLPEAGYIFPARDLVPDKFLKRHERFSFIVESLCYSDQQIGFFMLDMSNHINSIYGVLRRIISSIFHSAHLVRKIEHQKNELITTVEKLRTTMGGVIKTLSLTVETRDPYTAGHQRRVSDISRAIAEKMNLSPDTIEGIRVAGLVHDLGKIFTPAEILNKPGELMAIEFNLIKHHSEAGYNVLKHIDFPWPIADIVLQHHERCDGSGYPRGLSKNEILLGSRIICVADVVEAITSIRPYRAALGLELALDEIRQYREIKYDADAVDACLSLFLEEGYTMPL